MKKNLPIILAGLVTAASLSLAIPFLHAQPTNNGEPATPNVDKRPMRMVAALRELKMAKVELAATQRPFEGHREAAMKAVDQAIAEVNACIKVSEEKQQ